MWFKSISYFKFFSGTFLLLKKVLFSNAYKSTLYHYRYRKKNCIFISISEDTIIIIHLFISLYTFLLESLDSILSYPHVNFKK